MVSAAGLSGHWGPWWYCSSVAGFIGAV
jgi:hypothetical protein